MQRPPVYQSTAQLEVVKNRPELIASGSGDTRLQYIEDYITPQVIRLTSETILRPTAERTLDEQKPFVVPPPESVPERMAFLKSRFSVAREKEAGSNTPTNVLVLSFRAPHPADAPKYLRAIIAAYRDDLTRVYTSATAGQLKSLDEEIARLTKAKADTLVRLGELDRELRGGIDKAGHQVQGVSQEDLNSIRQRISHNRETETQLRLRQIVIEKDLDDIKNAGTTRAQRLAVMAKLNIPSERPGLFGDLRDPESLLAHLKTKKAELGVRLGPGHPEMISLSSQIKAVEEELVKRGPPEDELERYRRKLENEHAANVAQLKVLADVIAADEQTTRKMAPLQLAIDSNQAALVRDEGLLRDAKREKERVSATQTVSGYEMREVSSPSDGAQVAPVLTNSLLLGAVVGLLLGAGLALRAELADRSFHSPGDIRRHLGLPVLGHVPLIRTTEPAEVKPAAALDPLLAVFLRPRSAEAEAVRGIRTQLLFSTHNRDHQVIQITSPNAGDGKTTLASNLAIALAKADKRVVLVDCDFRKPRVHKLFGLPAPDVGLAAVVADQADLGAAIQGCEVENLSLLPCGPLPPNPGELLSSPRFQETLDDLRSTYDLVILDTPPVVAVADPAAVASRADGVILVFRMSPDARPAAERAKEELAAVSAHVLGVVVNASTGRDMGYGYGTGYRYDYQYADSYSEQKQKK
jgi:capsular exopolysaccharide synthesis family protein